MQHVIVDITDDVLRFPVSVINFVLKKKHGHGTIPVIPRAPGDIESRSVSEDVEVYYCRG